jgi:hypothetical protein
MWKILLTSLQPISACPIGQRILKAWKMIGKLKHPVKVLLKEIIMLLILQ